MQVDSTFALPDPDEDSRCHSDLVAQHIHDSIEAGGGTISFAEFMQQALYAPGLGYYVSGNRKFGDAGDFITAPELSPLFSRLVANQAASVLDQIDNGEVLELGAGSGALAVDLCRRLQELNALPERYMILEVSADLQQRQQQLIRDELPDQLQRFEWLSDLPAKYSGVVIANEVADALPVERFVRAGDGVQQLRVGSDAGNFVLASADAPAALGEAVAEIERDLGRGLGDGYQSEVSLGLAPWVKDIGAGLERGFIFLFDYGVGRREYYSVDRSGGWLRCHYRHRVHDNPLILPGIQDLTAWVDFTAVAGAASQSGLSIAGFVTQARFLMDSGLESELEQAMEESDRNRVDLLRQIKLLTLPGEMGENFKCIGLATDDIESPSGFAFGDRAHVL